MSERAALLAQIARQPVASPVLPAKPRLRLQPQLAPSQIDSMAPKSLSTGGSIVDLYGSNFQKGGILRIVGGSMSRDSTDYTLVDGGHLRIAMDAGTAAGSGSLQIINPDQQKANVLSFNIFAPAATGPQIGTMSPVTLPTSRPAYVDVYGTGLQRGAKAAVAAPGVNVTLGGSGFDSRFTFIDTGHIKLQDLHRVRHRTGLGGHHQSRWQELEQAELLGGHCAAADHQRFSRCS